MLVSSREDKEKGQGCYVTTAIAAFFVVVIVEWLWPDVIPFTLFEFWRLDGSISDVLKTSWPLFAWGAGVSFLLAILKRNDREVNRNAEAILGIGCLVSTWAGIAEEIAFRWLIFYDQIIGYKILNWLLFGWAGFGLFEWIYLHITGPIANFFTLGYLEPILFDGFGWAIGAALLTSNGKFRDGHIHKGFLGWINSWFVGMFFFYLMFQYGLIASIIVHFLYDMLIIIVVYIDAAIERALGWV